MPLRPPDWDFSPEGYQTAIIPADSKLVRVYNHQRRGPLDFNPTTKPIDDDRIHGRFDRVDGEHGLSYLYAARDPSVAFNESLDGAILPGKRGSGESSLTEREIAPLSVAYLRPTEPISVVGLRSQSETTSFGSECTTQIGNSEKYGVTREWGSYIRKHSSEPGFIWVSRTSDAVGDKSIVFFKRESGQELCDFDVEWEHPLSYGIGRQLLEKALATRRVRVS